MSGIERITEPLLDVVEQLFHAHQKGVELHGWPIVHSTRRAGPTVYRVLDRLEDAGWVTARWEEQDPELTRPRRRFYRLTPNGAAAVRSLLAERRPAALEPGAPPGRTAPGTTFWRRGLLGGGR